MIAPWEALAAIPDELPAEEAGPFMLRIGVTVFNAFAQCRRPVPVTSSRYKGIGGLGHLGVRVRATDGFPNGRARTQQKEQGTAGKETWRPPLILIRMSPTRWPNCKNSAGRE